SPDGSCGTIKLERMRAGINDRRYLATLEGLIRLRANSKDPQVLKEVQNARSLIANLKKGISVDIRDYFLSKVDAKEAGGSIGKWNSKLCDKYRWKIATQIMKLNK
ncbi:MAG: hypothetical protein KAG97_13235, partial [Victivallales bacterium]|nr:hypothetical protein [Victivallales bacterium]